MRLFYSVVAGFVASACSTLPYEQPVGANSGIGKFYDDHIAVLTYLPCDVVGNYNPTDLNAKHFVCGAGRLNEVVLALNPNDAGQTQSLTLHWRVYAAENALKNALNLNETALPFLDFVTQRYGQEQKEELYSFLEEKNKNTLKIGKFNFSHTIEKQENTRAEFDQHALVIYANK